MSIAWFLLFCFGLPLTGTAKGELPPADCVRLMRLSWQAERAGELGVAFERMHEALEQFPDEVVPLVEALRLQQEIELAESKKEATAESEVLSEGAAEVDRRRQALMETLRAKLTEWLADPEREIPYPSLRYLIDHSPDDPVFLEPLLRQVRARKEASDPESLQAQAMLEIRLGRKAEARDTVGRLLTPDSPYSPFLLAFHLDVELERWEDALALSETRLAADVQSPVWFSYYLEMLAKTGQAERFLKALDQLEERGNSVAIYDPMVESSIVKRAAWDFYDQQNLAVSEDLWRRILVVLPDDIEAQQVVAHLFASDEERLSLTLGVDQTLADSEDSDVLFDQGTQSLVVGDYERAFDLLYRASAEAGAKEVVWFNLGLAAVKTERWEEAITGLSRALELNPDRTDTYFNLALAQIALDDCEGVIRSLEPGLATDPDRWSFHYYLSKCYAAVGRDADASRAMNEYRARKPPDS